MKQFTIATVLLATIAMLAGLDANAGQRPQDSWGIHKIWGDDALDELPFVRGGYVAVEWADVNPRPGVFDFSIMDERLAHYARLGKCATIMVRGSVKPDYMFDEIPYHPERLSLQVRNKQGTLQYWHPQFRRRHEELLVALRDYLDESPYRSTVYSIRQTLNAVGTEHSGIRKEKRDKSQWVIPAGVKFVPYSKQQSRDYKRWVSEQYHELLSPNYLVFIRSVLLFEESDNLPRSVATAVEQGEVGLLHTSSVPEPTKVSTAKKYGVHKRYGRDGATPIYAEPFSSSTKGTRGDQPPTQWNYWRILSDLDAGVTYISVYGSDLKKFRDSEYQAAFEFGNRYAGYQTGNNVLQSPGAWVAFRDGDDPGDYTFLMNRLRGDDSEGMRAIGPATQRFGAWARRIPKGGRLRLEIDDRFAGAVAGQDMALEITYFDTSHPEFEVSATGVAAQSIRGSATDSWQTVRVPLGYADFSGNSGADITVSADSDVILHMVELVRTREPDHERLIAPDPPAELR